MINFELWLIRLGIVAGAFVAGWVGGCTHEAQKTQLQYQKAELAAGHKTELLEQELTHVRETNKQVLEFVASVYQRDIDSLRNRPPRRVEVIKAGTCTGVSGAELSGPDAEFLTGEAARAQRILEERDARTAELNAAVRACGLGP